MRIYKIPILTFTFGLIFLMYFGLFAIYLILSRKLQSTNLSISQVSLQASANEPEKIVPNSKQYLFDEIKRASHVQTQDQILTRESFKIPVLTYHHIDTVPSDQTKNPLAISLRVSPAAFDKQLDKLEKAGFQTLTIDEYWKIINQQMNKPNKPILLTFDDGFTDSYTNAFMILKKHAMKGNFAIITSMAGQGEYANWDQIREMKDAGMGMISHSTLHCPLAVKRVENKEIKYLANSPDTTLKPCSGFTHPETMSLGQVEYELAESKKTLQKELNLDIFSFAYPYGNYNSQTIDLLKKTGYKLAFTTRGEIPFESTNPQFEVSRIAVQGQQDTTLKNFFDKI